MLPEYIVLGMQHRDCFFQQGRGRRDHRLAMCVQGIAMATLHLLSLLLQGRQLPCFCLSILRLLPGFFLFCLLGKFGVGIILPDGIQQKSRAVGDPTGGLTALQCASGSRIPGRLLEIARILIEAGAEVTAKTKSWSHEIDAAYLAASAKNVPLFELLLGSGADATEEKALELARSFPGLKGMDLAKVVSCTERYGWRSSVWNLQTDSHPEIAASELPYHVVAYDYGVKHNILRMLADRGCKVTVLPAQATADDALKLKPDGVFLSNGPGDPEPCDYAIRAIQDIIAKDVPVFGICLGHQLLGLASGAKTMKMKFGHHGANHPVQDLDSKQVYITSQNHGFAVDESTLPKTVRTTHKSLFDGTLQGFTYTDKPAFCFQGHPEASPGPHDLSYLFDRFVKLMEKK